MGRSLQHISNGLRSLHGRNPQGAPRIPSRPPLITNFLLFLSGSGESENVRISLAECGSEQPEFAARNMATSEFAQRIKRIKNPLG